MFAILLLVGCLALGASGADVLLMSSSLFPVHRQTMQPLAAELVRRGHKVTWFEYGLKKVSS